MGTHVSDVGRMGGGVWVRVRGLFVEVAGVRVAYEKEG